MVTQSRRVPESRMKMMSEGSRNDGKQVHEASARMRRTMTNSPTVREK